MRPLVVDHFAAILLTLEAEVGTARRRERADVCDPHARRIRARHPRESPDFRAERPAARCRGQVEVKRRRYFFFACLLLLLLVFLEPL